MERENAIKIFLDQLGKVPNRDACKVATKEKIEEIAKKMNFGEIWNFLEEHDLDLTVKDIPKEQHYEVILASALFNEWSKDEIYTWEIWDESDKATGEMLNKVRELFECDILSDLTISDFLEYASSNKPDF